MKTIKLICVVLTIFTFYSISSLADEYNKRGYVTLLTLHNLDSLIYQSQDNLVDLKKYKSIDSIGSKKASIDISKNLMFASNELHESIINKKLYEKYEALKEISSNIEYFWIDFYDNKYMSNFIVCYKSNKYFKDILDSINMYDTETAYPSVVEQIDKFNLNLSKCINSSQ